MDIFQEDCGDDHVEVVVLNADHNYDHVIDPQYEIEIQGDEQIANDSLAEKEAKVEQKVILETKVAVKKEKKIVQRSTRRTRSSKSPKTTNKSNILKKEQLEKIATDIVLKKEEERVQTPIRSTEDAKNVFYYDTENAEETDASPPPKKRRGRSKSIKTENIETDEIKTVLPVKRNTRSKTQRKTNDLPRGYAFEDESGDEFPPRDSDNDDWPSRTTLGDFPKKIIENGLLLVKGKKLMSMICKYYKLECDLCETKTRFKLVCRNVAFFRWKLLPNVFFADIYANCSVTIRMIIKKKVMLAVVKSSFIVIQPSSCIWLGISSQMPSGEFLISKICANFALKNQFLCSKVPHMRLHGNPT